MPDKVNILLVGGGGREHAIATAISRSPRVGDLWTTHPENPGLAKLARAVDVPVSAREIYRLQQFCDHKKIGLVVVGPEEPLAEGFADKLASPTRVVFGPLAEAARLEADKAWAKQVMRSASIPTADSRTFSDFTAAKSYVETREEAPVIKAAGLAKGKGVIVAATTEEAIVALERIMVQRIFGDAGRTVVVEERLEGPEVSVLAIVDGRNILVLPPCQDHKRLGDNDTGPNTGGMGAFCPSHTLTPDVMETVEREILVPTIDALRRDGIDYRGVLYAGLMLTPAGPKVLEFNVRFGDPECQPLMTRLKSDIIELMLATCAGKLDQIDVEWSEQPACCVVLAAKGYPDKPRAGDAITGLDQAEKLPGVSVFHAGTRRNEKGQIVTSGGRVLGVTALGADLPDARRRAYEAADLINFDGKVMRRDIGASE
ncbi:MAG: phosphoribosylamine--glycine ligase [Phycisphaerales bacterium]|jgi:phosphoribosylamine--glycine ligase|nr:phosphoribosylamine--glycine ligase [Phycisphaerales bacterium]